MPPVAITPHQSTASVTAGGTSAVATAVATAAGADQAATDPECEPPGDDAVRTINILNRGGL
ncbi:hypothetical protein GCM10010217_43580 [Streptomyces tubercidicus]